MFIMCDTRGMCRASRGRPLSLWITKGCSASPGTAPAPNCPPIRQAGAWVIGAFTLSLEDLILIDRDSPAEPVLALGHRDVLPGHGRRAAGAILHREVEVLLRREMARVRAPGLPLLARGAATGQQERFRSRANASASRTWADPPQEVGLRVIVPSPRKPVNRPFVLDSPNKVWTP